MIKYVLILLWFNVGQNHTVDPTGQAWINYFDTQEQCLYAMSRVPKPTNRNIEWYSLACAKFEFSHSQTISARQIPGEWF